MADLTIWISGADFIKIGEFLTEEGSNFLKLFWPKSAEIRDFSRQEYVGMFVSGTPSFFAPEGRRLFEIR